MKSLASSRKKPDRSTPAGRRALKAAGVKIPGVRARKQKTITNDETCLHMHCKSWLDKSGIWSRLLIFHVANERKGGIGAIIHFKRMGVRNGVADWLAFPAGRAVAIELKDDEGDQDTDQEIFQRKWEAAGNTYFLCRTLEEFQGVVQAIALFA